MHFKDPAVILSPSPIYGNGFERRRRIFYELALVLVSAQRANIQPAYF